VLKALGKPDKRRDLPVASYLAVAALVGTGQQKRALVMKDLRSAARLLLQGDVSLIDLWMSYWNHGGRCHPFVLDAFIFEVLLDPRLNMEALAAAVQELSLETAD
jgi:hypothetical protein